MSFRLRLTLLYSLALALALTLVSIAVYGLTRRALYQALEQQLETAARSYLSGDSPIEVLRLPSNAYFETVVYPEYHDLPSDARQLTARGVRMQNPRRNPSDTEVWRRLSPEDAEQLRETLELQTRVRLEDDSQLIAHAYLRELEMPRWLPDYLQTFSSQELYDLMASGSLERQLMRFSAQNQVSVVPAMLLFASPVDGVLRDLKDLRRVLLIATLGTFLLFVLAVWWLSQTALRPLKRVVRTADKVSSQDLSQRVPVPRNKDELRELAETINQMLMRLENSFETQRRFTADASHELRTPVTAITGHANYLLRRSNPSTTQQESLEVIKSEAERMAKLVGDLLELARADAGFTVQREPFNLLEVAEDVQRELSPVAGESIIRVHSSDLLMEVLGDSQRLKQVLLNLTHNALNAGARHVDITLSSSTCQGEACIEVEVLDDGPGIPQEAIPHLFERFYRVDGARKGSGSGLGLSIVKWIIDQHDGEIRLESKVGEGTVFYLCLPTP